MLPYQQGLTDRRISALERRGAHFKRTGTGQLDHEYTDRAPGQVRTLLVGFTANGILLPSLR